MVIVGDLALMRPHSAMLLEIEIKRSFSIMTAIPVNYHVFRKMHCVVKGQATLAVCLTVHFSLG